MMDVIDKDAMLGDSLKVKGVKDEVSPVLQFLLVAFSVFFWVIAAVFCGIGSLTHTQAASFKELSEFAYGPGILFFVLGVSIFFMSIIGVLGAARQNLRLLNIYKVFLVCILGFEVFCGFIAAAFWPEMRKMIDERIGNAIRRYTDGKGDVEGGEEKFIDMLQRQLQCCGSFNIDDWDSNPYFSCKHIESYLACGVPWSCCRAKFYRNRHCGLGLRKSRRKIVLKEYIHTVGCMDKANDLFEKNMTLIAAFALANVLPLIFGTFMTFAFVKQIRRQRRRLKSVKNTDDPVET